MTKLIEALCSEIKDLNLIFSLILTCDLTYINEKRENALLLSIHYDLPLVALEILKQPNNGIDQVDYLGNNTLVLALKKSYEEVSLQIIKSGIKNINYIDKHGDTALSCALRYEYNSVSNELLNNPTINVNHVDKHGDSILLIAVDHLLEDIGMKIVSNFNVNFNYINKHGFDAVTLCITKRLRNLANLLIDKGVNTQHVSNLGDTSLIYALNNDFADIAEKIVKNNTDNSAITANGDIAFFHAIINGNEDIAKMMLEKGNSNFEVINADNNTSLILALTCDMFSLSYKLVKVGSENFIKHINKNYDTALFLAMNKGQWQIVHEIVESKMYDINVQNTEGDTTLFLAINYGVEDLCLKMFEDNRDIIDVNVINNDGNTLLMCAIICGMRELSKKIIEKISIHNLNFQNKHLDNALMICINLKYYDVVDKILDFEEADVHLINKYGDTPLILLLNDNQIHLSNKLLCNRSYQHLDHRSESGLCAREMLQHTNELRHFA